MTHFDVIIVGAGLSGIGAAYYLQDRCPRKTYAILESRDALGGTWDLFRYPGIRSDSDMHTLGYDFKPWTEAKAIADGPAILKYVNETADDNDIRRHIRFRHKVAAAAWSSADACWRLTVDRTDTGESTEYSCSFLYMCGGYYSYERAYVPEFEGMERFTGEVVYPQFWPEDLDYRGKRVVVIGSGATAMTVVPAMAKAGAQVTMVQRSPTYVVSRPDKDKIANTLRKFLPEKVAYAITRWKNVRLQQAVYRRTRIRPERVKNLLISRVREALGDDYDVEKHFTPRYNPWDQRLCLIPNGDLFEVIKDGSARVVTDSIDGFTEQGLTLHSGEQLEADILVMATGLEMEVMSGVQFSIDGQQVSFPDVVTYKGLMYSDIPNMVHTFGYVNASWTLKADITAEYVCRLLQHMDELGVRQVTARLRAEDEDMTLGPWISDFSAGYMQRVMDRFPKQGDRDPWRNTQNYLLDRRLIRHAPLEDGALTFSNPLSDAGAPEEAEQQAASAG